MKITPEHLRDRQFISLISDLHELVIGDIVVISHAHNCVNGFYSSHTYDSYYYDGLIDRGHNFISTEHEHEAFYTNQIYDRGNVIEGVVIDKLYLRKFKIKRLLKEKPSA